MRAIARDIHLRVLQYLDRELGVGEERRKSWYRPWVEGGLVAVEAMLAGDARTGRLCHWCSPQLSIKIPAPAKAGTPVRRFSLIAFVARLGAQITCPRPSAAARGCESEGSGWLAFASLLERY